MRRKIPESLWRSAVKLAGSHGVHRTARALRLNYYALKKRVSGASGVRGGESPATFVELVSPEVCGPRSGAECVVELENARGERMRIHAKGDGVVDVAELSAMFWTTHR